MPFAPDTVEAYMTETYPAEYRKLCSCVRRDGTEVSVWARGHRAPGSLLAVWTHFQVRVAGEPKNGLPREHSDLLPTFLRLHLDPAGGHEAANQMAQEAEARVRARGAA